MTPIILIFSVITLSFAIYFLLKSNSSFISKDLNTNFNPEIPELSIVNVLVENISAGVVITDGKFGILVANKSAKEMIGATGKKEVTIFDFIDNLGGKFDIMGKLEESLKLNKTFNSEEVQIKDKIYKMSVFPIEIDENGEKKTLGMVIFHNVTTLHTVQEIRDQFTSMVVHELRTPLSGINKISELLRSSGQNGQKELDKSEKDNYIKMINIDSSNMLDLVNDILDIAKLEAGKFDVKKEKKDIKKIIDNRVEFWRPSIEDANLKMSVSFDPQLTTEILLDESGIKQVLNNLISNAVKFTTTGGSINIFAIHHRKNTKVSDELARLNTKPTVNIPEEKFTNIGESLVVGVSDTSAGISSTGIKELFTKWKQLGNKAQTGQKGSGLGLFIAKGIVEGHGGGIDVASDLGIGSVFFFILPL